jgi:hypothetical protein
MSLAPPPYILTLKLDDRSFEWLDGLRRQHFPPARNFLPAHVTLFHALPGEEGTSIRQTLHPLCSEILPLRLSFSTLRYLGKGVAVEVQCPELLQLRKQLATVWQEWLTPQDIQGYRPHVTVQNKVAPATARSLYDGLIQGWQPREGEGSGLLLWHYLGGPWELSEAFDFSDPAA